MTATPPPAPAPVRARNKWIRAAVDYGPLAAFFIANRITHDLIQATGALVVASLLAVAFAYITEKRIAPLPLLAAIFAIIFGGLTLIFHDERFVMVKPTVLNFTLGVVMLAGVWLRKNPLKALLGPAIHLPDPAWRTLTIRYGAFFLFQAALNEAVWRTQSHDFWVNFRTFGLPGLAILFSFTQLPLMMKGMKEMEEGENAAKTDDSPPVA
jgi:intracellular septation protein